MKNNDFKDIVLNRHSVKRYDPTVKISHEEMNEIIKMATAAPSAINFQPWRFVVIDSAEGKNKLSKFVQFNTVQCETSAAMILVMADKDYYKFGEKIYAKDVKLGYMPQSVKEEILPERIDIYGSLGAEDSLHKAALECGLVSMLLMLTARSYGYDTNPMSGFDGDDILKEFNLDKTRYVPIVMISIGKKAKEGHKTSRFEVEEIVQYK